MNGWTTNDSSFSHQGLIISQHRWLHHQLNIKNEFQLNNNNMITIWYSNKERITDKQQHKVMPIEIQVVCWKKKKFKSPLQQKRKKAVLSYTVTAMTHWMHLYSNPIWTISQSTHIQTFSYILSCLSNDFLAVYLTL